MVPTLGIKQLLTESKIQKSGSLLLLSGGLFKYIKITHEHRISNKKTFRKDSDPRLENLAAISGGKTYFVKDGKFE